MDFSRANEVVLDAVLVEYFQRKSALAGLPNFELYLLVPDAASAFILLNFSLILLALQTECNVGIHFSHCFRIPRQFHFQRMNDKFAQNGVEISDVQVNLDDVLDGLHNLVPSLLFDEDGLNIMAHSWHFDEFLEREAYECGNTDLVLDEFEFKRVVGVGLEHVNFIDKNFSPGEIDAVEITLVFNSDVEDRP